MREVELTQAFHFWCDECGEGNFTHSKIAELTDDEAEEAYRKFHLMEDYEELPENWRDFDMCCIPDQVTCARCGTTFRAKNEERA